MSIAPYVNVHPVDPNDGSLTFVKEFPAPKCETGEDLREIVYGYMMKEASVEWIPKEDFSIGWSPDKTKGDFSVGLSYKKGEICHGVTYSQMSCSLDLFEQYLEDGVFADETYYYNDCVGNNCSSAIMAACNVVMDFVRKGGFKPSFPEREGVTEFPIPLEWPKEDPWYSKELFDTNGEEKIFEAYAASKRGDVMLKSIRKSGHVRLVDRVETVRDENGKIDPALSAVFCTEQTNQFDKNRQEARSSFFVSRRYSFKNLFEKEFMPITFCIYKEKKPDLLPAYIVFDGKNTPETVFSGLNGRISSNFPLNYVRLTLKDGDGKTKAWVTRFLEFKEYEYTLSDEFGELVKKAAPGKYTFTLRAGIGRGGCDIERFEINVK